MGEREKESRFDMDQDTRTAYELLAAFRHAANDARGHYGIEQCSGPTEPSTEWDEIQERLTQLAREADELLMRGECVCALHDGICEIHETITSVVLERIEHAKQVRREHGGRPGYEGFHDVRGERDRYRQALIDIAGYEAWQGDPKPAVIAARALEGLKCQPSGGTR